MFRYGHHASHPAFGILLVVLLGALLVVGVVALVRIWRTPPGRSRSFRTVTLPGAVNDPALAELRIRYARGDVTWDEYSQRASNLGYPLPQGTGPAGSSPEGQAPPPAA
jgi:uncharacterized membrane protein